MPLDELMMCVFHSDTLVTLLYSKVPSSVMLCICFSVMKENTDTLLEAGKEVGLKVNAE
jgi:hypothetical protein